MNLAQLIPMLFDRKRSFFPFPSLLIPPASDGGYEAPDFVEVIIYEPRTHNVARGS